MAQAAWMRDTLLHRAGAVVRLRFSKPKAGVASRPCASYHLPVGAKGDERRVPRTPADLLTRELVRAETGTNE